MNKEKYIPSIPQLPPEIFIAHMQEKLAIFTGAGISRIAGCKSWTELASDLLHICREKQLINYYEEERIKKIEDNKRKITIAKEMLFNNGYSKEFYKAFRKSLKFKKEIGIPFCYDISKLGDIFITTNADKCFDYIFSKEFIKKDKEYDSVIPEKNHLYHIHGSQDKNDSLVFTASEYHRRYNDKYFSKFLRTVFDNYTVLFIGYGLAEFELLDYIMKNSPLRKNEIPNHYILQAYNSFENKIAECDSLYYKELNVNLIPYSIDENGYEQLITIINRWKDDISNQKDINVNKINVFDNEIKVIPFGYEEVRKIINLINLKNNDDPLLYRLIKHCYSNPEKAHYFVNQLKDLDAFNPKNNPEPISKGENLYSILTWNILEIAEICFDYSLKNNIVKEKKIIKDIINEIIKFNRIDNYHTAEWLINNIFKLPENEIDTKYINYIDKALTSRFDTLLQSQALFKSFTKNVIFYNDENKIFTIFEKLLSLKSYNNRSSTKMDLYCLNQLIEQTYTILAQKNPNRFISILEDCLNKIPTTHYEYHVAACYYNSNNRLETDNMYTIQTIINLYLWVLKQRKDIKQYIELKTKQQNFIGGLCNKLIEVNFSEKEYSHTESNYDYSYAEEVEIKKNLFAQLSIDEVIKILKEYNVKQYNFIQEQSLISSFHFWLIENYSTIINNLYLFYDLNLFWHDQIIIVTNQLLSEHKTFNYENIIELIEKTIYPDSNIWKSKNHKYPTSNELKYIKNISEFISSYAETSKIDFNIYKKLRFLAGMIFTNRKFNFEKLRPYEIGYVTRYLNSEAGRISDAMFVLNNIYYSINKSTDKEFFEIIENEILRDKKDEMFLFATGAYLNYLFIQNRSWLDNNLNKLFSEPFFDGLFNYCHIYKELYIYLTEKEVFGYILEHSINQEWIKQMINYSCFNVFHDGESLEDENCLLRQLINKISPTVIDSIVQFIRRNSELKFSQKIIKELWGYIYKSLIQIRNLEAYKNVLQELLYLLDYITVIDKNIYEYLKLSCSNLTQYSMDLYIIQKFSELYKVKHNKKFIEKLFEMITDKDIYFYDYKNSISNFLKEIAQNNISLARKLCDKYYYNSGYDKYTDLVKELKKKEMKESDFLNK